MMHSDEIAIIRPNVKETKGAHSLAPNSLQAAALLICNHNRSKGLQIK
jgi:hypothetical protein